MLNKAFVLEHFDEVSLWLNSKEFKEKYEKENHPYPPLLNPDKLNDENYILNYEKIPAEKAWEMNLPLPRRYEFVLMFNSCSGSEAMHHFFRLCGLKVGVWGISGKNTFIKNYNNSLSKEKNLITLCPNSDKYYEKNCYLIDGEYKILFTMRDPISRIKTCLNHIHNRLTNENINANMRQITAFDTNFQFPQIIYNFQKTCQDYKPDINALYSLIEGEYMKKFIFNLDARLKILKQNKQIALNFDTDLSYQNAFETYHILSKRLNFTPCNEKYRFIFEKKVNFYAGLNHLPVKISFDTFDVWISIPYFHSELENYINITPYIFNSNFILDNVFVLMEKDKEHYFLKNKNLKNIKLFIARYIQELKKYTDGVKKDLICEKDILNFLKHNNVLSLKLNKIIEKDLQEIKTHRPDIVASWKYYKEFEKICENL
nr:DUF2972 domain-containing protein [Campylobacter upsaliensis]